MPDNVPVADHQGRLTVPDSGPGPSVAARLPVSLAGPAESAAGPADGGADVQHAWDIGMRRWDLLYGVVYIAGLVIVASQSATADRRALAIGAVAALGPWYLLVGRRHMHLAESTITRRAVVYMTGVVLLFSIAVLQVPNAWFLAVAIFPQCYHVLPVRRALIPAVVMTVAGGVSVAYWNRSAGGLETAAALVVAVLAFTVAFGGYIGRIITQSAERACLIAELEAARAELAGVSRQAGVLAERQRLAGDIHDTLAQGFSSILMLIQAAEVQLERAPETARRQLELAGQTARENLAEARTLVSGLASVQLQTGTLADALRRITERAGAELGLSAGFQATGARCPLPAAQEVVLLRIGQEALANVRKHAAAHSISVSLSYEDSLVRLEVTDDGVGFEPALVNGGYGLSGMRARVDEIGGKVTVRSAPAQGTSVVVEVPA